MNPHATHPASIVGMAKSVVRHRQLIRQFTKRDVAGRYRGSMFGLAWSFVSPLLMLAIYTFFFSVIFRARWGGPADQSTAAFAIVLFAGLIVHGFFTECVTRAPGLILANANLVKKVVFPLEILPWTSLGSALFHAGASLSVLLVAQLLLTGSLPWTVIWLPLVALPLVLGTMGVSWALAALGVYIRDVGQVTGMFTTILLFLSPVFYSPSVLEEPYRSLLYLNPLTPIIEDVRNVAINGVSPAWGRLAIVSGVALLVAQAGYWFFQRTRKGFSDVM